MNVGLHELSIGSGENPHGVGSGKSPKESMVVGPTAVSFASRLEALHGSPIASSIEKIGLLPVVPTMSNSATTSTAETNDTAVAVGSCDERVLPRKDLSLCDSANNATMSKQADIVTPIDGKGSASGDVSIRTLSDARIRLKHPAPVTQLETKHSEPAKRVLLHASGQIQDISQANATSSGAVRSPTFMSTGDNSMPPRLSEAKLTGGSITPVSSVTKDKVAKQQPGVLRSSADSAVESSALALRPVAEGGAGTVSVDGKSGAANEDLLGTKTPFVETAGAMVSVAPLSSAALTVGISHWAIRGIEHAPNSSSTETQTQHSLETDTNSLENAGYSSDGVTPTVLQASSSALEVGLPSGAHGWVKIRAEVHDGGLVHATLSAGSSSGQEMLHRELPGLTRFLASEHVAVLPFLAEHRLPVGLHSGQGSSGSTADTQSDSRQQEARLTGLVDASVSDSDGEERQSALSGGVIEIGPSSRSSGNGSWLNIRV